MKHIIAKNTLLKVSIVSLIGLFSFTANAAEGDPVNTESWGSPVATYSNVNLGSGTEGIDISANFGGYLGGVYQHRIEVAAKQDLEHYEANYLLLNSASDSGVTIESTWSEDVEFDRDEGPDAFFENVDSVEVGLFSKLKFPDDRLSAYPKMSVGYMWGDDIIDSTFVTFEIAVRFNVNDQIWVGAAPVYIHSMDGVEIEEFQGTVDAGIKLSETFGVSASVNHDQEFLGRVIFAF